MAGNLDVIPKTIKAVPLETACRIDFVGLVVVKQIEDHILLQSVPEESRKTNYHSIGKMRGGPFFNFKPVLSVRLCFRIERVFAFVMWPGRVRINVNRRNQNKAIGSHLRQRVDQCSDLLPIPVGFFIGFPLNRRNASANQQVVMLADNVSNIGRIVEVVETAGAKQV
ncbi:hypothetical protein HED52_04850 [Ochrobactrum ciceri]|uniref:Uncharacterized protein n=1 Tax=Brucella ciceri TaxID=391287 RepID=A0ABX1DWG8_9HYPH|nr:hypothetical protein [Brucella ciceri]